MKTHKRALMSTERYSQLANRNILLGITGGIAAYKTAELVRRLQDQHARVKVVMTSAATEFITPLTMQAVSGQAVHLDLLDTDAEAAMGHIELARWADIMLIAPASADFLAKLANGSADDLLSTVWLACQAPKFVAPAMNQAMWSQPATQANMQRLTAQGIKQLGPDSGAQACGDIGAGRLLEVPDIIAGIAATLDSGLLAGKRVLITAGPTREAIDPVRYLSNRSSGKMGFAVARAAIEAGALTTLIAGPVNLQTPERVTRVDVISAKDMLDATLNRVADCDIFIATAAVADYTPAQVADQKIKKNESSMALELTRTEDILATVSNLTPRPFCVGFAAETTKLEEYARGKLERKNLDMVIANDVSNAAIGFQSDENAVCVVSKDNSQHIEQMSKQALAQKLIQIISEVVSR